MRIVRFNFLILLPLVVLVVFGVSLFVWQSKIPVAHSGLGDNLAGHAWDDVFGWSSYNNCNSAYIPIILTNCYPSASPGWGMHAQITSDDSGITDGNITGWMWHDALGWICIGSTCASHTTACGSGSRPSGDVYGATSVTFGPPNASGWTELQGWGKICAWGDSGDSSWVSFNCSNTNDCGSVDYKVFLNTNDFTLGHKDLPNVGYAWNGFGDFGTGYIEFSPSLSVAHTIHIETEEGDIYAFNGITGAVPPSTGVFNATYLILSNSAVVNFDSEERYKTITEVYEREDVDLGGLPSEVGVGTKVYAGLLGAIDVQSLLDGPTVSIGPTTGGIGSLDGLVYHSAGDLTVDSALQFTVPSSGTSGAGTIIVEGDLYIGENSTYEFANLSELQNLPNVTYIVLGDVVVDPLVTDIVGNYFVLGNGTACAALGSPSAGCGRFSTGDTQTAALNHSGVIMAKQFNFERQYTDALDTPAASFVYDGRLVANPSPGFVDIASLLPQFVEESPF